MNKRNPWLVLILGSLVLPGRAQEPAVAPPMETIVRASCDFLAALTNFSVQCTRRIENKKTARIYEVTARRPDRLRVFSDSYLDPVLWDYDTGQVSITRGGQEEPARHPALEAGFPFAPADHPDPAERGLHHTLYMVDMLAGRLADRVLAQAVPNAQAVPDTVHYNSAVCHRIRVKQADGTTYELYIQQGATPFIHLIRQLAAPDGTPEDPARPPQVLAEELYKRWRRNSPDVDRVLDPNPQLTASEAAVYAEASAACEQVLQKLRNGETPTEAEKARCGDAPELFFAEVSRQTGRSVNFKFPEPERTLFYLLAIQAGLVDWERHGGWAFISDIRHHVQPRLKALFAEKPEPLLAFCLLFPAQESGDTAEAGRLLDYLADHDVFLAGKAVEWTATASGDPDWYIDYYLNKGQAGRAEQLAGFAQASGSQAGLEARARLLIRLGRLAEAEACYKEVETRHAYVGSLAGFYLAQRDQRDAEGVTYQQRLDELIARCFPGGLRTVRLEDFSAPPGAGVVFNEDDNRIRRAGLAKGAAIVALDGRAVADLAQYYIVREMDAANPQMELIVWTGTEYKAVTLFVPRRRFGLDLQSYVPGTIVGN